MAPPVLELAVEVVYATSEEQRVVRVAFAPGLTAEQAVRRSGLLEAFPDVAARPLVLGVFGLRVELRHRLSPGDRVEICRPLLRDPRDRRRELAG
jgi:putative ubiquitin-RnfH superfamily antitoxin RatB of RatAB toxin-antitoxin module